MPTPAEWNAAKVESMLTRAFEWAASAEEDGPMPEDVASEIRAIAEMRPPDEEDEEEGDGDEEDDMEGVP